MWACGSLEYPRTVWYTGQQNSDALATVRAAVLSLPRFSLHSDPAGQTRPYLPNYLVAKLQHKRPGTGELFGPVSHALLAKVAFFELSNSRALL